ncbi:MAG: multidrug efflux protein [Verrucomicrobiaceae bacterium]|nr:multidrug efflux protein [Verrucomicrobiaceae bacterium]
MNITDIFIRRPVLATVVSLMILVLGLRAVFDLPVRQFPKLESANITVTTAYFGANPDVIAGFITTPIEAAVAQAQGIDYLTSTSVNGLSTITANLRLNYDSNRALTEITTKVNSVLNQLPPEAQRPQIDVAQTEAAAAMFINFNSNVLSTTQMTDYIVRVVQPKLQTVAGVQSATISAGRPFALRVWLDARKLAAYDLTGEDIFTILNKNHYLAAIGSTMGQMTEITLSSTSDLHSVEEFRQLVIKQKGDALVRLQDVANVVLGSENYDSSGRINGTRSLAIQVKTAPEANLLDVNARVRALIPEIKAQLPAGVDTYVVYDASVYVSTSIHEVIKTLLEALVIVTVVVFLFLGTVRTSIVPAIAVPLSLIGAFMLMMVLGYSINMLTLLALVLGIGLVVDDAIIIVENVDRHLKEGMTPMQAALAGASELTGPIIAISVVLIAVYIPIGFQGGLTGKLFTEFAFTLAGAVAVSAVVALTLSPMMCSRLLKGHADSKLARMVDRNLEITRRIYDYLLGHALDATKVVIAFGVVIVVLIAVMGKLSQSELAPAEDQGFIINMVTGPATATLQQMEMYAQQITEATRDIPERQTQLMLIGFGGKNNAFAPFITKPWGERKRSSNEIQADMQQRFNSIAGARVASISPPSLPGSGGGLPVQFVIKTTEPLQNLDEVARQFEQKVQETGMFFYLDNDLKFDKPQTNVVIDRDKVAAMGLTMRDVGTALTTVLGGGYVNYFSMQGRSYKVMPQIQQTDRLNPEQLNDYYIRLPSGSSVPASTFISFNTETIPETVHHFQQLNAATISGITGAPIGDVLNKLQQIAKETLPDGYDIDYGGLSRQSIQESNTFAITVSFAILIIFLVLAAQFESFRDPLIIMAAVPMAIFGAMVFIFLGAATLNIYTEVGLITLVGLIAKHGILIVQYANDEQRRGLNKRQAIESAAGTRLRPILMTSAAMVLGALPLTFSGGAGAAARNNMGLVITTGISIGTLFTLFIVPAMYLLLAADHRKKTEQDTAVENSPQPLQH